MIMYVYTFCNGKLVIPNDLVIAKDSGEAISMEVMTGLMTNESSLGYNVDLTLQVSVRSPDSTAYYTEDSFRF